MVTTNDNALAKKILDIQARTPFLPFAMNQILIRTFLLEYLLHSPELLWLGRTANILLNKLKGSFYFLDELLIDMPTKYPYPCRLSAVQARLGISQLNMLEKNIHHRQNLAKYLEDKIGWYGMREQNMSRCTWLRYSFLVKDRDAFIKRFSHGFDLGIWFPSVVGGRSKDLNIVGYLEGSCPVAERVSRHIVNFPTHPRIPIDMMRGELERNWSWLKEQLLV